MLSISVNYLIPLRGCLKLYMYTLMIDFKVNWHNHFWYEQICTKFVLTQGTSFIYFECGYQLEYSVKVRLKFEIKDYQLHAYN